MPELGTREAYAYTDGASTGSRGPGGYGAVMTWKGKTVEISGREQDTTNLRMELTAACVALESIDKGHVVTVYSDSSYLVNCMRRRWYKKWRENGWLNHRNEPVANRDLWERLLEAELRHQEVLWRKVKGHSKTGGPHKTGNDRADELAVAAKKEAEGGRRNGSRPLEKRETPKLAGEAPGSMMQKGSRVAAIYDIHGNLSALEAVLADFQSVDPDLIVVGGDVVAGPMPAEVLDCLAQLGEGVCFVRGNADREVLAAYDDGRYADAIDLADPAERAAAYAASKIDRAHRDLLASFSEYLVVEVEGLGQVLFCHGSPRSDEEIMTAATTEGRLHEILAGIDQDLVVCGHTHAQFDRRVGGKRVINAGSVGMPYQGKPVGAFWLLLGVDGVYLRRSDYDLDRAVRRIRATGYPDAEDMAEILLEPPDPEWVAHFFEQQATSG